MISGIAASPGIALGKAFCIAIEKINMNQKKISPENIYQEIQKFTKAKEKTIKQLEKIKKKASKTFGQDKEDIFEGYIMILQDPEFQKEIITLIKIQNFSADTATFTVIENQAKTLEKLDDDYLKNRAIDIRDIGKRLIKNILKTNNTQLNIQEENIILIAHDLTPSETAQINLKKIIGFATDLGGLTSHTSIMARSLELPAIVGISNITKQVKHGDFIILDSLNNEIYINPSKSIIKQKQNLKKQFLEEKNKLRKLKSFPAITLDGHQIEIGANISNPNDAKQAQDNGAESIGLYRTEFLFMNRKSLPSEEEQFQAYKLVAKTMNGKPVIIRTMDIGGDKNLPYMNLPKEDNPFLGWRAIRIAMVRKEILQTQLRAILKASIFGKLRIMFPMIISVEEIQILKSEITNIKKQLTVSNIDFDKSIEIGIMIET
ncbi:phosphoenolpyruvate--protein phosphotransferase, partial [Buchnera aphidicola (Hormaphis cornu)]